MEEHNQCLKGHYGGKALVEGSCEMEANSQCVLEGEEGIPCLEESSLRDEGQGASPQHSGATLVGDSPCLEAGTREGRCLHVLLWVEGSRHEGACTPAGCELGAEEDSHGRGENTTGTDGQEEDEVSRSPDQTGADNLHVADGTLRQACKRGGEGGEGWRSGGALVERWNGRMEAGWTSDMMEALVADSPWMGVCMRVAWGACSQGQPKETRNCCRLPAISAPCSLQACYRIAHLMAGC